MKNNVMLNTSYLSDIKKIARSLGSGILLMALEAISFDKACGLLASCQSVVNIFDFKNINCIDEKLLISAI